MFTRTTEIPSVQAVLDDINALSSSIGCFIDSENVQRMIYVKRLEMYDAEQVLKKFNIVGNSNSESSNLKTYIYDNNLTGYFTQTKAGALSLSEESFDKFFDTYGAMNYDKEDDETLSLMKAWRKYASAKLAISRIQGSDEEGAGYVNIQSSGIPSCDGHKMGRIFPLYVGQNTGRFGATKPALGAIDKEWVNDFITVPYGYSYVNIDMKQTDPTWYSNLIFKDDLLNKLIILEGDTYFGYIHYVRLKEGQIGFTENDKMERTEAMIRDRQNIKRMVNKLNYGGRIANDGELGILFNKYLSNHPNRLELIDRIKKKLSIGSYVVAPYFRSLTIDVRVTDDRTIKMYGSSGLQDAWIRKTLAYMIQGTTAEIMRYKYMDVKNYLAEHAPNTYIIGTVHDSLKVMVNNNEIDQIKDYLDHCMEVEVEGLPLKIGCESEWRYGSYGR